MNQKLRKEKIKLEKRNIYFKKNYIKIINKIDLTKDELLQIRNGLDFVSAIIKCKNYAYELIFIQSRDEDRNHIIALNIVYIILNKKEKNKWTIIKKITNKEDYISNKYNISKLKNFLENKNNNIIIETMIDKFYKETLMDNIFNYISKSMKLKIDLKSE